MQIIWLETCQRWISIRYCKCTLLVEITIRDHWVPTVAFVVKAADKHRVSNVSEPWEIRGINYFPFVSFPVQHSPKTSCLWVTWGWGKTKVSNTFTVVYIVHWLLRRVTPSFAWHSKKFVHGRENAALAADKFASSYPAITRQSPLRVQYPRGSWTWQNASSHRHVGARSATEDLRFVLLALLNVLRVTIEINLKSEYAHELAQHLVSKRLWEENPWAKSKLPRFLGAIAS